MAETLYADSSVSGSITSPTNAFGASDGTFTTDTGNTNWTHRWGLDNPVGTIETDQTVTIVVVVRKDSSGGNDPAVTSVDLLDNGTSLGIDTTGWTVTSPTGEMINASVAATGIANNGDNLQVEIVSTGAGGPPSSRRAVQVDSIEVTVQNAAASSTGTGSVAENSDTVTGSGSVEIAGSGVITETTDIVSGSGGVEVSGAGAAFGAADQPAGSGGVEVSGSGAISESPDTISGTGSIGSEATGSGAFAESSDSISGSGSVPVAGFGTITETADSISGAGSVEVSAAGSVAESQDAVSGSGGVETIGTGAVAENPDIVSGSDGAYQGGSVYSCRRLAVAGSMLVTGGGS